MSALGGIRVSAAMLVCAGLMTPAALAVGGDNCSSPTVISTFPYSDTGNTCGFQDDYDESCPSVAGGSPDVVYQYTPTETHFVEVSLCAGSDYDTKLYVYVEQCFDSLVACVDDLCSTPNMPNEWVSRLGFRAEEGRSYYIVVDGWGGHCGNYTIDVTGGLPLECPPDTLYGQRPHSPADPWEASVSDLDFDEIFPPPTAGAIIYDEFTAPGQICGLQWTGLTLWHDGSMFVECVEDPMQFRVGFWTDDNGEPGVLQCEYFISAEAEPTGLFYVGYPMYLWEFDLWPICCDLEQGWVSIQGYIGEDCWLYWGSSPLGDGTALQDLTNGGSIQLVIDRSVCLTGRIGACCLPGGQCESMVLLNCVAAGGVYLGNGTHCEAGCAPPSNDTCETAALLPVPGHAVDSNALANDDVTPVCGTPSPYQGVWYAVEGTGERLIATTCAPASSFDTMIQVFCDCGSLVCVGGNDDAPGAPTECELYGAAVLSTVDWCSQPGHLYYIKVGGFGTNTGQYDLFVHTEGPCGPPVECPVVMGRCCFPACPWDCGDGDGFVGIIDFLALLAQWGGPGPCDINEQNGVDIIDFLDMLANWGPCPSEPGCEVIDAATCGMIGGQWTPGVTCAVPCPVPEPGEACSDCLEIVHLPYATAFDNSAATADGPPGSCNSGSAVVMQNDVWLCYAPPDTGTLQLVVDTDYDGLVAVYEGPECASLVEVACHDPQPMVIQFEASAGNVYWFQIGDWGTVPGGGYTSFELDWLGG